MEINWWNSINFKFIWILKFKKKIIQWTQKSQKLLVQMHILEEYLCSKNIPTIWVSIFFGKHPASITINLQKNLLWKTSCLFNYLQKSTRILFTCFYQFFTQFFYTFFPNIISLLSLKFVTKKIAYVAIHLRIFLTIFFNVKKFKWFLCKL